MRRIAISTALALGVLSTAAPAAFGQVAAPAQSADSALRASLGRSMRAAGGASGAYVRNATDRRTLFRWRAFTRRTLASNVKAFTTAAALGRLGADATLPTTVLASAPLEPTGTLRGDLYLRGGGDPTFGSGVFTRRAYGDGATIEGLAGAVAATGVRLVTGRVVGDESRFDPLRGGPDSGYGVSRWVGPLSALSYNRGLAKESGSAFQKNPPDFAAERLEDALEARGVTVRRGAVPGATPEGARMLAEVRSPTMARLVRLTNKPSDNFFAEMLLKGLGATGGRQGTTAAGARSAMSYARGLGAVARLVDGSGLSRANRATPKSVARLLEAMRARASFEAFQDSLSVAGRDGTLYDRMRSGPARGRCRAKTGTLSGVSALSGYCRSRAGDTIVFSILMNGVNVANARRQQNRMAQAMAGYRG